MIKSPNQISGEIRFDWDRNEILEILNMPLVDLMWESQIVHRKYNKYEVQLASLYSVKTGGCEEDCAYCSQSIYSASQIKSHPQFEVEAVLKRAKTAKEEGADRFCMGWAWREIREGKPFNSMLEMVKGVRELGMEACVTAGMLTDEQALRLADAGLTAYNHNLDTSPEYYKNIITTRTYQDRLDTIKRVRNAGINVCCGGIIGLGENNEDRASLLEVLSNMNPHPESVPINSLVAIEGTGLEDTPINELCGSLDNIPENIRGAVRNNGGGHANHSLFWKILSPINESTIPSSPSSELLNAINAAFGDMDSFKTEFSNAAATRFGSGWAWLIKNDDGSVSVISTPNQDNPYMEGKTPILGLDVWEHAYYLNYQNRRPDYINAFFEIINWKMVSELFEV